MMNGRVSALPVAILAASVLACTQQGQSAPAPSPDTTTSSTAAPPVVASPPTAVATPVPAQPRLAATPEQMADDLVSDEQALRNPSASEAVLVAAARRLQVAYRDIARHPEWDAIVRSRIPAWLSHIYDLNIDARHQLDALVSTETLRDTVPAWRIEPPAPADELLGYYRKAEGASGVDWNYLAAINMIETRFGRIVGPSSAGAQGPMQFLPSTFAGYGDGGDIYSPHDSIMAAGRYLAANNFASDPDHALFRYNNSDLYVRAVNDYAAVLAADPAAFTGYYRWDVYYRTTAGDVVLPVGYAASAPIPVADYLATHPQ